MPLFQYQARNRRGELLRGEIDAMEEGAVARFLRNNDLIPVAIHPAQGGRSLREVWDRLNHRPIRRADVILFSRQLYALLHAGVALLPALDSLRATYGDASPIGQVLRAVRADLDGGRPLSVALRPHPKVFSELYVRLVEVGETTGNLDQVLLQLAGYLEQDEDTVSRVKRALRYPGFVIVAMAVALAILNTFVIPAFARLFASAHVSLPVFTRILIATSDFFVHYWWVLLLGLIGAGAGGRAWLHTPKGRMLWGRWQLKVPIFGPLLLKSAMARFARTLALSSRAGVPLLKGIELVIGATNNPFLGERLMQMRRGIERGESLTATARATGLFPPLVLQMLAVGETSGNLDTLMDEVGGFYEREVSAEVDSLSARIEPVMIVLMGGLVLILALGIYLPMWDMVKLIHH